MPGGYKIPTLKKGEKPRKSISELENEKKKKQYRGSYVKHNEQGYYCISCFNYTQKKYYLKKLQDNTGTAWRCPHCNIMIIDWAFERIWKEHQEKLKKHREAKALRKNTRI